MMIFFFNVCKTSWVYDLRTLIWYFKQILKKKHTFSIFNSIDILDQTNLLVVGGGSGVVLCTVGHLATSTSSIH